MDQDLDDIEASRLSGHIKANRLSGHVVGNAKSFAAGSASDAELYGVVGVAFLLHNGVIVDHFFSAIVRTLVSK